jgi:ferric-dicitrate binding protein FerR (iron transport regulator)
MSEAEERELLREAGPRPALAPEDLAAIDRGARAAWRARYGRRSAAPRGLWIGLAAAAALAVAIGLAWRAETVEPGAAVARIDVLGGDVRIAGEAPGLPALAAGGALPAGAWLETGSSAGRAGRLALRLAGGASLRLDGGSRLRLVAADRVELERGALYIDSGPVGAAPVSVLTRSGRFAELGTQFEVRLLAAAGGGAARLRVREGRVVVESGATRAVGAAGEELRVSADGSLVRAACPRSGLEWSWVLEVAPPLDIEGVPVRAYLDWYARETGLEIELADAAAVDRASHARLRGSIAHLGVEQTPEVVLPSAGLASARRDGRLFVFVAAGGR